MVVSKKPSDIIFFNLILFYSMLFAEGLCGQHSNEMASDNNPTFHVTEGVEDVKANPPRPNIIVILADDMGWSDLGCYGGEIPTPNIDALAEGGIRFTQFYNNSVCGPTRSSLLTGLYAQRVGHSGRAWNQPTNYNKSITLGEGLQRSGYHTMVVGKWQDPDLPAKRGFDRFYGSQCAGIISYFDEVPKNEFFLNEQRVELPSDFYLTDDITDYAVQFLDEAASEPELDDKPFFLYVAHIAPHWPLHALEKDVLPNRERYQDVGWDDWSKYRLDNQYKLGLIPEDWPVTPRPDSVHEWTHDEYKNWQAERMAVYAAQISSIDRSTGRIVEALKKSGELENTLIIFLSDNGAAPDGGLEPSKSGFGFGSDPAANKWPLNGKTINGGSGPNNLPGPSNTFAAYGLGWALMCNTPFRATKMTGYEGGIRTPLIAHWPEGIESKGGIVNDMGHVFDFMPTFLELAGGSYPTELDGRKPLPLDGQSLVPVFHGKRIPQPDYLAFRVPQDRVLISGDWKIISKDESSPWELYNLTNDGTETINLADQHPEIVQRLASKWSRWTSSLPEPPK